MPEYCCQIEVWYAADSLVEANRFADEFGDLLERVEVPPVSAVTNSPALEEPGGR